jgi:hypothetical protein
MLRLLVEHVCDFGSLGVDPAIGGIEKGGKLSHLEEIIKGVERSE